MKHFLTFKIKNLELSAKIDNFTADLRDKTSFLTFTDILNKKKLSYESLKKQIFGILVNTGLIFSFKSAYQ